ncbi:MAG TPA: hypothetical protein VLM37_09350 [Fibrobacteraceae bacterium]|nr:hypothetical protein [Fibrobacteraceae bacterium]
MNHFLWKSALLIVPLLSCLEQNESALFDGASSTQATVQAYVLNEADSVFVTRTNDTVAPGDSLVFEGEISPAQGTKISAMWWEIDGKQVNDESYFRWTFTQSGIHSVVYLVTDRFGDTLDDTAWVTVNSAPSLGPHFLPRDSAWGVDGALGANLAFEWELDDPDSTDIVTSRMTLRREACADGRGDSLLLDTLLTSPALTWWDSLGTLCAYRWIVSASDQFGQGSNPASDTNHFSSGALDGSGAFLLRLARSGRETAQGLRVIFSPLGSDLDTLYSNAAGQVNLPSAVPGEYHIFISDPVYPDYIPIATQVSLYSGQFAILDSQVLQDTTPPQQSCLNCSNDTLINEDPICLLVVDSGCGLDTSLVETYLDGQLISHEFRGDTLLIPLPSYTLVSQWHPIESRVSDVLGNTDTHLFWLPVQDSVATVED